MKAWRRDDGYTIVEVLVALTVFSVGILAVAKTMDSSFNTANRNAHRARALAVATERLELTRSLPFEKVTDEAPQTKTVGGTSFTFERAVVPIPGVPYKKVIVAVSWTDAAGGHEISEATYVYPTAARGAATTTTAVSSVLPVAPSITDLTKLRATGYGTITWSAPPNVGRKLDRFVIERSLRNDFTADVWTLTEREPPNSSSFDVSGLAAGTTYFFRVRAVYVDGAVSEWSPVGTVTTNSSFGVETCRARKVTVTPAEATRMSPYPSPLLVAPAVTVETSGTCTGLYMRYQGPDGDLVDAPLVGPVGSKIFTATVSNSASSKWQVGQYSVEVREGTTTKHGSAAFVVCEAGGMCG